MGNSPANPLSEPGSVGGHPNADAVNKILERWPEIELALERFGRSEKLVSELQGYITDLRNDASTVRSLRTVTMVATGAYILFTNLLLICLLFYHQFFFLMMGTYGHTALIIVVFSSSVILIAKVLAGLFRTHGDRHKDDMLPPHLQTIMEAIRAMQS